MFALITHRRTNTQGSDSSVLMASCTPVSKTAEDRLE